MECTKCKTKMDKGVMQNTFLWVPSDDKIIDASKFGGNKETAVIYTYKCGNCGNVELKAK